MKKRKTKLLMILFLLSIQVFVVQNNAGIMSNEAVIQSHYHRLPRVDFNPLDAEIYIDSDDDFLSYVFPGNGSASNPYRIENYTIDTYKLFGILVVNTTKHVIVRNNTVSARYTALKAEFNTPNTISFHNNTLYNSTIGLCVKFTANIIARNNTCYNNDYGMTFNSVLTLGIENNIIYENDKGLNLENNNSFSNIQYNNLWDNNESIIIINSKDVMIGNNTVRNNDLGIILQTMNSNIPTVNCSVIYNIFENNTRYGISLPAFYEHRWTENNKIHHNTFANNNAKGKKQALDDGINNIWDDSEKTGNYWSDWWGIGAYNIPGLAKSKDRYPLEDPLHEVITHIPGIFKGRILIFVFFVPLLLGGYIFVKNREKVLKIKKE